MMEESEAGQMPRYVARVGPTRMFEGHRRFANPTRPFAWVTEPADLRGIENPAESMLKSGWMWAWVEPLLGEDISVCIVDTWARAGRQGETVTVSSSEWPDLARVALNDDVLVADLEAVNIPMHRTPLLFESLFKAPAGATPYAPNRKTEVEALELRRALERRFGTTSHYIGIGAFWREHRKLGGRALWVFPNGTDYRLTADNHRLVSLGRLSREHLDRPAEIETVCEDEVEIKRERSHICVHAREVGPDATRARDLWLDNENAPALADAIESCVRDETMQAVKHGNDSLAVIISGPEPQPSYFIQNRRGTVSPRAGVYSLAVTQKAATMLITMLRDGNEPKSTSKPSQSG